MRQPKHSRFANLLAGTALAAAACKRPPAVPAPICPSSPKQVEDQALGYCADGDQESGEFECVDTPLAGGPLRYLRIGCGCPIAGVEGYDACVPGSTCTALPGRPTCVRTECTRRSDCAMLKPPLPDGQAWGCVDGRCAPPGCSR